MHTRIDNANVMKNATSASYNKRISLHGDGNAPAICTSGAATVNAASPTID